MCDFIQIDKGEEMWVELWTLGEIKEYGWTVEPDDAPEDWTDQACMCGVDVESILIRNVGQEGLWTYDVSYGYIVKEKNK